MKENYTISDIYQGGYSSLSPSYGDVFTGYRVAASELGAPTKPDTANQIQQVNQLLNQGIIPIEVGALDPKIFEQIPKQHFKEINRMTKLTGAKISVHAPLIEPSGITEQGWSEANRELAERQLNDVVEKSIEMDDKGSMPITIHSAGIPGTEYKMTPEGKKVEKLIVINQETGKMAPIEEETKFYPMIENLKKGKIYTPEKELEALNDTEWINSITNLEFYKKEADEIMSGALAPLAPLFTEYEKGEPIEITSQQKIAMQKLQRAELFLQNVETSFNAAYNKAYKYGDKRTKEELKKISEHWIKENKDMIKEIEKSGGITPVQEAKMIFKKAKLIDESIHGIRDAPDKKLAGIKNINTPQVYVPIEDFAIKHSSETFANVAFNAYDKFRDKAPTISVENLFPGMAFSMGDEMDNLITKSKEKFVEKAVKKGVSESLAKEQADRMIGMTLDVGHLNIAKKKGFEDKDLLKEVEQIAKHVKHVHLTDNFGYSDSHLPPGMGNVPIKEILEKLEKKGVDVKKLRKIVEAGGFVQHFGVSPYPISLEAMGSPIYSMDMAPYWNQALGLQQGYFSGYGQMLPQVNYETFGSGFSQLPAELGGQRPGAEGSRMSGKGME